MRYRYEFDDTRDGGLRLRRTSYEILQDAYLRLRDELEAWNRRALDHGASTPPYEQEVDDLNRMLAWGDEQLAQAGANEITVRWPFILRTATFAIFMTCGRASASEDPPHPVPHASSDTVTVTPAAGASRLPLSSTARHRIVRVPDPSGFHS